ncbi:MAG: poly(A) polymerase [Candidatus Azotimanducaceae bacterium]|jgi:poly(A) polymerase
MSDDIAITLNADQINLNARKVVKRLQDSGYEAYLVGGCVRDLLLGKTPKDFDVSTNAHPEEVRDLFRNSRMIGRRFMIVHVRFGREIIEVATFRAEHPEENHDTYDSSHISEGGMILSDNRYGTFREDARRRDFTINALYYDPENQEILDPLEGIEDLKRQQIRLIGTPVDRYREDPVRMLRALRFRAKLGFEIEEQTRAAISELGYLLQDIPPARLFEEVLKLFMSGYGKEALYCLTEEDTFRWLFPDTESLLNDSHHRSLIELALESTDTRIGNDMPVTPAFIFAALLWGPFLKERQRLIDEEGVTIYAANMEAANNVVAKQQLFTSIPKRFSGPMREIWFLQFRLPNKTGKKAIAVASHKRFRAAYDFLLLRERSGEALDDLGAFWTQYQIDNPLPDHRNSPRGMSEQPNGNSQGTRRRRRKRPPQNS